MIGDLIQQRRRAKGLSQTELARRTGLSQNYVSKLESGRIDLPQRGTLEVLSGALDITLADLYRAAGVLDAPPPADPPGLYPDDLEAADLRALFANPEVAAALRDIRAREGDEAYRQALDIIADQLGVTLRAIVRGRAH